MQGVIQQRAQLLRLVLLVLLLAARPLLTDQAQALQQRRRQP